MMDNQTNRVVENMKINSPELQKNFPLIYKNFFNTHDIILSGDAILTWWTDISHGISALRIKQKLPTKTYCWANTNASGKVTFHTVYHYSIFKDAFDEDLFTVFSKYDTERLAQFIQDFLLENGFSGGMEIDFLAEAPKWHGFASSGVLSVLLSFLLYAITGKLDPKTLTESELAVDHPLFNEIYWLSLRLSNCISRGKSIGASTNYTVMMPDNSMPTVFFSQNSPLCLEGEKNSGTEAMDWALYKGTLKDFLWMDEVNNQELPLDYGVIFTGINYKFSEIESTRELVKKENDRLDSFIIHSIQSLSIKDEDRTILSNLLGFDKNEVYNKNIDITNLRILEWFDYLFKNTYNDSAVNAFINTIKNIGLTSFSCQKENRLFFALQYLFHQYQQFEDEEIGILPFNSGKIGGSLFFVMKQEKSRLTIMKVLEHLNRDGYLASLDYASWRDGSSHDGICMDQFITEKVYSNYTKEGQIVFTDTLGASYSGDYNTIIELEKDCILLDTVRGRIYVKGTKLTSKDIHSQNTTIDMLRLLIEHLWEEVSNSKLPVSTYSQNKNEILSKVVLPIRKISKEYFWKEISLVCSGGITDYFLLLEKDDDIRIGIIKKS